MTLVIMAAGLGSRYGGSKQTDSIGKNGEFIIDYSIYDAKQAGFNKVIFIIKKDNYETFRSTIGSRVKGIRVEYAFQDINDIPDGTAVPEGRTKPWGTGHAVLAARNLINDNFAVINADDFYGRETYELIFKYMNNAAPGQWCMAGYSLCNTVTEHGTVSRGVCSTDENDCLTDVTERTKIAKNGNIIAYYENDTEYPLDINTTVSMNCWGFTKDFIGVLSRGFEKFMKAEKENPQKCEYYLPTAVKEAMAEGICSVKVLKTPCKWFGVTYKEDKQTVVDTIAEMTDKGIYPEKLWN